VECPIALRVIDVKALRRKFKLLFRSLDERPRRLAAAAEARMLGRGGITAVARATGLTRVTIRRGIAELDSGILLAPAACPRAKAAKRGKKRGRRAKAA
jgi:hypothetical protein